MNPYANTSYMQNEASALGHGAATPNAGPLVITRHAMIVLSGIFKIVDSMDATADRLIGAEPPKVTNTPDSQPPDGSINELKQGLINLTHRMQALSERLDRI